jgi:ABC-type antimicrobial peptide transport system permease subunit
MLRNYLLVAIRNLTRNKAFSAINILGLALGLTCSLFIGLWVLDERNVDQFNVHGDRLYSVYERQFTGGVIKIQPNTPGVLAEGIKRELPQVEYASSVSHNEVNTFQTGEKILKEEGCYADIDFFTMFTYPLLEGDKATVLTQPANMAISRKMAVDLFGSPRAAIGQPLLFNNNVEMKVTGVFEDLPLNASRKFDYVINYSFFLKENGGMTKWTNTGVITYFMLKENANPATMSRQLSQLLDGHTHYGNGYRVELDIQRFKDMYLHSHFNSLGQLEGGRIEYVRLFSLVAVFILLIACINFMNITTARSARRAKEIGVRKVVGALRISLVRQFIGEALMLTGIAMAVALLLLAILLPAFNSLTQKQIAFPSGVVFWVSVTGVLLSTGFIAGSYPALFLSSFRPVSVLKGTEGIRWFRPRRSVSKQLGRRSLKLSGGNVLFRKGLVVFQFVISIALIVGTIVVSRQVNYIQTKDLGYERENLIYIPQEGSINDKFKVFKEEALKIPGVQYISHLDGQPTNITRSTWGIDWVGKDPASKPTFGNQEVGYDFTKTMGIELVRGHDFRPEMATDAGGYILNEEAIRIMGYKDPIGKTFTLWGRKGPIIGVVKDFHFNSLHVPVRGFVMFLDESARGGTILIRTQPGPGKTRQALDGLAALWKQMNPKFPFSYQFSDDEYNKLYKSEQMAGRLSNCFAALAIAISCLGLLGLAIFTAEQRTREIGIRKVLGASVRSLFGLLSG